MRYPLACLAPVMLLAIAIGCGPAAAPVAPARPSAPATEVHDDHADHGHADHDHDHDEPTSFADGVAKLESLNADLADKLGASAGEAADDAVHALGHLLEEVRDLAKKESFQADAATAVTTALDELEECFGKVDEAFHSGDEKADPAQVLDAVKERLKAAFTALKEATR